MSLIGTLEQIKLARVLERIEIYNKTGLLIVKLEPQWVELYFRGGRLMCIGPVRTQASLGERLLQEGVVTAAAYQEVARVLGEDQSSETRTALTLMDMGFVGHEELRAWSMRKALQVLQALSMWTSGDLYFDEDVPPPSDRLLVAHMVSTLLSYLPPAETAAAPAATTPETITPETITPVPTARETSRPQAEAPAAVPKEAKSGPDMSRIPTLTQASQFFSDAPVAEVQSSSSNALSLNLAPPLDLSLADDVSDESSRKSEAVPVIVPRQVDTSFMQPDMILMPADLSNLREQKVEFQLTPDHWRLLTCVDGRMTLRAAAQDLAMLPEVLCKVAGELKSLGLVSLVAPGFVAPYMSPSAVEEQVSMPVTPDYMLPGYAATSVPPWSAPLPNSDVLPSFSAPLPPGTRSQWGNGGNGATFVPGRGWVASPQPMQSIPSNGLYASGSDVYVPVGGRR